LGLTALVAGRGRLPVVLARRLRSMGVALAVFALEGADGELRDLSCHFREFQSLALGDLVSGLLSLGVRELYMAGLVPKSLALRGEALDEVGARILRSLDRRDDHSLLGAVVSFLSAHGIRVRSYLEHLSDMLAEPGLMAGRFPSPEEWLDVSYGRRVLKAILPLSFGQTVVVRGRSVVAVEAMEGTDETILRAGRICPGGVVVKMMRSDQDERYDVPVVGDDTLEAMARSRCRVLAVEAGRTILLDKPAFLERADRAGISVVGIRP